MLKRTPLAITGLILGLATLGNVLRSYSENIRLIFGLIAGLLFIGVTVKIILDFEGFRKDMTNPVLASVFCTYSMALMILSTYIKPYIGQGAKIIWFIAIGLHILLIIYFTVTFTKKRNIMMVTASWFITYVGIVVASITAPAYEALGIGQGAFWFGLVSYIILLPIVFYRIIKVKQIPDPVIPTTAIACAPGSLLLAGYMNSFEDKNILMIYGLLLISQVLYLYVLFALPSLIKRPFLPSFSAFTFPFAISALALKLTNTYLVKTGQAIGWLKYLVKVEEVLALFLILYVLLKYLIFIGKKEKIV